MPLMTIGANWNLIKKYATHGVYLVKLSACFPVYCRFFEVLSRSNYGFSAVAAEENCILQG